jgi:hypothetical protein
MLAVADDPNTEYRPAQQACREMTREESAALAAKRIREALADPGHLGPLLHEALILLRCFEGGSRGE